MSNRDRRREKKKKNSVGAVIHVFRCKFWTLIGERGRVRVFVKPWCLLWGELVAMCLRGGSWYTGRAVYHKSQPAVFFFILFSSQGPFFFFSRKIARGLCCWWTMIFIAVVWSFFFHCGETERETTVQDALHSRSCVTKKLQIITPPPPPLSLCYTLRRHRPHWPPTVSDYSRRPTWLLYNDCRPVQNLIPITHTQPSPTNSSSGIKI